MKLYKVTCRIIGKGTYLDEDVELGFVIGLNDGPVFAHIKDKYTIDCWETSSFLKEKARETGAQIFGYEDRACYIKQYGWEDLGEISEEEIECLKRLGLIKN